MTPFFHLDLSLKGRFAIVRRYGDTTRVRTALKRWRRGLDAGQRVPEGNAVYVGHNFGRGVGVADVLSQTGLIPVNDLAHWPIVFVRADESGRAVVTPEPVASDLDASGACRCGCGYVAPRPPESTDHGAAI